MKFIFQFLSDMKFIFQVYILFCLKNYNLLYEFMLLLEQKKCLIDILLCLYEYLYCVKYLIYKPMIVSVNYLFCFCPSLKQNSQTFLLVGFMAFNATFNNILVISWRSVLLVDKTTDLPQVTDKLDIRTEVYIPVYIPSFILYNEICLYWTLNETESCVN